MADGTTDAAILYAEETTTNQNQAAATIKVCGISLLDRQLKQLRRHGVGLAIVYAPEQTESVRKSVTRASRRDQTIIFAATAGELSAAVRETGKAHFIVTKANALIDDRILSAVLGHAADNAVAYVSGGKSDGLPAAAKVTVKDIEPAATFEQLIERFGDRAALIDMDALPLYMPGLRRDQPMLYTVVDNADKKARLTRQIIGRGQKGTLDWPARYLHPPVEDFLTALIAETPITPNQISIFVAIVGFAATWLFAEGELVVALVLALVVGVLDGVDGKLARSKMMQTKLGEAEHLLDKVVEYSWYLALAVYFAPIYGSAVWGLALVITGFAAAEAIQGEFYRRLTGAQLDDAGEFERRWRLVGGRRNTFMWGFLVFVLANAAYAGFWFIAIYSLVTFFVAQVCFIIRLMNYAGNNSETMAQNIRRTAYL